MSDITVIKRDGQVTQLDLEKIHKMVELLAEDLLVSLSLLLR